MREKIDCFLHCSTPDVMGKTVAQLRASKAVQNIFLLTTKPDCGNDMEDISALQVNNLTSSNTLMSIAENAHAEYTLIQTKDTAINLGEGALDRLLRVATDSNAAMVYPDRFQHPAIDYQLGSIRDDFDFGSLLLIKTSLLHTFAMQAGEHDYQYAGLYALRLFLSRNGQIFHLNEALYAETETDTRASGV